MEKKEIIDETFDPNRTESYDLSVQVSPNGFTFCINDTVRDLFISLVNYPLEHSLSVDDEWGNAVGQIFAQHDILGRKFKKILFSFDSNLFTVIPTDLFIPERAKQLFELVHPLPELYEVRFNHVKEINATILFALPSSLTAQWLFRQPQTVFIGHALPLIYNSAFHKSSKDEPNVFVNFSNQFFVNAISLNKELKYCNTFDIHGIDDTAYHLINSCRLNSIDHSKSILTINGSIDDSSELENLLSKYFKKVIVDGGFEGHHYSYSIVKYKRTYWNLFNLSQCE